MPGTNTAAYFAAAKVMKWCFHLKKNNDGHLGKPGEEESPDEGEDGEEEDDRRNGQADEIDNDEDADRLGRWVLWKSFLSVSTIDI